MLNLFIACIVHKGLVGRVGLPEAFFVFAPVKYKFLVSSFNIFRFSDSKCEEMTQDSFATFREKINVICGRHFKSSQLTPFCAKGQAGSV